jgi:signal transduction histidine kinase
MNRQRMTWHDSYHARPSGAMAGEMHRLDRWERREQPAIAVLPYLMLVFSSFLTIVLVAGPKMVAALAVAALAGAWLLFGFTLRPAWRKRQAWMTTFFIVLLVLMAVLVLLSPVFGFFSFTGYFFAFWLPFGRWRLLGVTGIAVITATSQAGGLPAGTPASYALWGGIVLVNILVAGSLTWFGFVSSEQNDRRKQALADLGEANRRLEETLAENAGLHEQLLAQAREAGVTDERQRLAREIHDTLAQSLAGIITQLQAADQVGRDTERRRHLDAALRLARESLTEARRSVAALRPEPLQASRIEDALVVVASRWSALHDIRADVATTGQVRPLEPEAELTLLRAAQEALANVAKHARAGRVGLTLSYFGDQVTLDVRDDGIGFCQAELEPALALALSGTGMSGGTVGGAAAGGGDDHGHHSGGFGLVAMRQRVEGLAGTVAIESEPAVGTTISVTLPVTVACGEPCPDLRDQSCPAEAVAPGAGQ